MAARDDGTTKGGGPWAMDGASANAEVERDDGRDAEQPWRTAMARGDGRTSVDGESRNAESRTRRWAKRRTSNALARATNRTTRAAAKRR
jgi:hypothetical protein